MPVPQIGNYKVIRKLGEGGMGVVFLAEHTVMGRLAAVKLLLPAMSESQEAVTRFFNEARATARIRHPGIVEILDCAQMANGQAYIVMEYLEGETLGAYVGRQGKLTGDIELARAILRQVATALGAAHALGIIHRDLKPDNVFLASEGGVTDVATIKILDFGIAKLVKAGAPGKAPGITHTKELLGTPVYISPEQCKGARDLDHRTDIYALGCIAFEMLTAQPVFIADSLGELIASHMFKPPPPLLEQDPAVPPALGALVMRMLAKAPDDRPATMADVVAAIDAAGAPTALRGAAVALPAAKPLVIIPADAPVTSVPTMAGHEYAALPRSEPGTLKAQTLEPLAKPPAPAAPRLTRGRVSVALVAAAVLFGGALWLFGGSSEPPAAVAPAPTPVAPRPPPVPVAPAPAPVPAPAARAPEPAPVAAPAVLAPEPKAVKRPSKAAPKANPTKRRHGDLFLDL